MGLDSSIGVAWRLKMASLGPKLARTRGDGHDVARSQRALDWYLRSFTPLWVEKLGLPEEARSLRELPPVHDAASAEAATATVQLVLERVQQEGQKASQELAQVLQGISGPPAVGEAWNEAVNRAEEVARSEPISALQQALTEAARSAAPDLSEKAGWNWAVSARDMAAQSLAWRAALGAITESVAAAVRGDPWRPATEEAGAAAMAALSPVASELAHAALGLFEALIDPR